MTLIDRDFSSVSDRALRCALALAARTGALLHVLHAEVLYDHQTSPEERRSPMEGLDGLRDTLKEEGTLSAEALEDVTIVDAVRRDVVPVPAVLRYAAEEAMDLVVLGTHGRRGPSRVLLGSVAEEVVRRARQPVLAVRGEDGVGTTSPESLDCILVPVDFSDYSREALRHAREWGALFGARIDVLHVIEETLHPAFYVGGVQSIYDVDSNIEEKVRESWRPSSTRRKARTWLQRFTWDPGRLPRPSLSSSRSTARTWSACRRTGLERFFMGSVAEKVVRHVRCPVLTVKAFGSLLVEGTTEERAAVDA